MTGVIWEVTVRHQDTEAFSGTLRSELHSPSSGLSQKPKSSLSTLVTTGKISISSSYNSLKYFLEEPRSEACLFTHYKILLLVPYYSTPSISMPENTTSDY